MIKKFRIIFFGGLFLNLFFLGSNPLLKAEEELVRCLVGETKIFPTRAPIRVVIGNPAVADIAEVTNSEITLNAKSPGVTTLVYWDAFGEQSLKIRVAQEDMQEIKRRVDNLLDKLGLDEVYTKAEDDEGKVILLGRVKSPQERERIALALGPLKEKTVDLIEVKEEEAVIEIEVQILELNKDATDTLGFTWPSSVTLTETGSPGLTGAKWSTLFKVLQGSRAAFTLKLDALVQEGKVRVLSRPRLACQSGKEAQLLVGGEKPVFTTTVAAETGAQGTAVSYKEFGIKLNIKPTVIDEDRIKLALDVEVSEVGTAETIGATTAPTAKAYPLTKRTATTELYLNDGQTMAIGGLMKQKKEEDITKTPGFGDIPILGFFFRKKVTKIGGGQGERGDSELFITLTPQIVSEKKEIREVKREIPPEPASPTMTRNIPEPVAGYAWVIQKRILENLTYPASARQAGFQGTTKLGLRLSYSGELLEVTIKSSSGYTILDDNAASVAQGISAYPPFPPSIEQKEVWVDVPIVYRLD